MRRDEGGALLDRPVGERALEQQGFLHLRLRDALAGVEAEEPGGGQGATAKHGIAGPAGGRDGELCMVEAPLDAVDEAHQPGEPQVDVGEEVELAGRLDEGLSRADPSPPARSRSSPTAG